MLLPHHSIKELYAPALAEGEGMGTAYEYYVKRRALARLLQDMERPTSILIAGLPEKYGTSLDFLLLATELGAKVMVVDDRSQAIARLREALARLAGMPDGPQIASPTHVVVSDLASLATLDARFDLVLSSEVLQRLSPDHRVRYVNKLAGLTRAFALFCPNADNQAHNTRSGLGGLTLEEIRALATDRDLQTRANVRDAPRSVSSGFIDMPPFPPGITRSAEQRADATSGRFEGAVMNGLGYYARFERLLPPFIRRRQSHIVYAFAG